jgi:SAM-dependent MidA family methyltransferase
MPTFKDFMESALYEPKAGYYPNREVKADFYTAPELHPAFAGVLARQLVVKLEALKARGVAEPYHLVEMGSGSGLLARQILAELKAHHPGWALKIRYVLIERSRNLLLDSVTALSQAHERVLGYTDLAELAPVNGVFFSNELVDAFPVHLLERREGKVHEVYVDEKGRASLGGLSTLELKPHVQALDEALDGQRHAVNLEAARWMAAVARRLKNGSVVTIDYGSRLKPGVCNPPRAYFRHSVDDRLTAPGRDLTANVDFEILIDAGSCHGLVLESYGTLANFLIKGGIEEFFGRTTSYKDRTQMKTLIHPDGMGERFKVLVQSKGLKS